MICIIIAGWMVLLWGAEETLGEKAAVGFPLTDVGSGADCKLGQKVGANFITHNKRGLLSCPKRQPLRACSSELRSRPKDKRRVRKTDKTAPPSVPWPEPLFCLELRRYMGLEAPS